MSNYLIALALSMFIASAAGTAYFLEHPNELPAAQAFINSYISTPSTTNNNNVVAKAPEINASSGTNAIAILIGVLLLASEKYRAKC